MTPKKLKLKDENGKVFEVPYTQHEGKKLVDLDDLISEKLFQLHGKGKCITLSDLRAMLYETREEVASHEDVSVRGKHPERAQGVEVYFHALKRKLRALEKRR